MDTNELQYLFHEQFSQFDTPENRVFNLWNEILTHYSEPHRHYHNLNHLHFFHRQLLSCRSQVIQWTPIVLAMFYHDAIYHPGWPDNEARSEALARARLTAAGLPDPVINQCCMLIRATQYHESGTDADTSLFIDADLSILGQPRDVYLAYAADIREEFSFMNRIAWANGRSNVLRRFLGMERIFRTKPFQSFEEQARRNLKAELEILTNGW